MDRLTDWLIVDMVELGVLHVHNFEIILGALLRSSRLYLLSVVCLLYVTFWKFILSITALFYFVFQYVPNLCTSNVFCRDKSYLLLGR